VYEPAFLVAQKIHQSKESGSFDSDALSCGVLAQDDAREYYLFSAIGILMPFSCAKCLASS
jgi:hypothetical protein